MGQFLKAVSETSSAQDGGFPADLECLTLREAGNNSEDLEFGDTTNHRPLNNLKHLCLDLSHESRTAALLEYLRPTKVTHLSLGFGRDDVLSLEQAKQKKPEVDDFCSFVSDAVPCLRELEVTNAWQTSKFLSSIRTMNEEAFLDPKQVFLNSPPPLPGTAGLHRTQTDKAKVEEIEFLSARIQGHTFWENRWGTGARCLHLSNIDLNSIRINNITSKDSHAGLGELRVLILTSKWKIDQGVPAWLWTLNDDSFDAGRAGKPVEDKPPRAGYKIIHEILEQSLEDLRLLSIDGRNFLIEHERDLKEKARKALKGPFLKRAIPMARALKCRRYVAIMEADLDDNDWEAVTVGGRRLAPTANEYQKRKADRMIFVASRVRDTSIA